MVTFADKLNRLVNVFNYVITARHKKGHGIHSPAVYEFAEKVLFDNTCFDEFRNIEKAIDTLKKNNTVIEIEEYGAGSGVFKSRKRKVCDIARHAGTNKKFGRLLFRMARWYNPSLIIEFGTSVGISTLYLSSGTKQNSKILTVEANKNLVSIAQANAVELNLVNIEYLTASFDETLKRFENEQFENAIIFIDGNHTYNATLRYFNFFSSRLKKGFILFDDIYWSRGMNAAWKQIKANSNVTIDIFSAGIVIKGDMLTPKHYKIRF